GLGVDGRAPHLAVVAPRRAEFFLHRDALAARPVLGRLELSRRKLPPRIGLAGVPQELRPQQAPHVLNPRMHRHNPQHPTPRPLPHRSVSPRLAVQRKWRSTSLAYPRPSEALFSVFHLGTPPRAGGGRSVSAGPPAMARSSSPVTGVSRKAHPSTSAAAGMRAPGTRTTRERLPMAPLMKQTSSWNVGRSGPTASRVYVSAEDPAARHSLARSSMWTGRMR